MPEIIDTVSLLPDLCQTFVVNNAVDYVTPAAPVTIGYKLENQSAKNIFLKGDSFSILSCGIILPESFTFWKDPAAISTALPKLTLYMKGAVSLDSYQIDVLSENQGFYLPMENYEYTFDVFVDCHKQKKFGIVPPVYLNENFTLSTDNCAVLISMKGVPAALNGKTFLIVPFFKILHNFPII